MEVWLEMLVAGSAEVSWGGRLCAQRRCWFRGQVVASASHTDLLNSGFVLLCYFIP